MDAEDRDDRLRNAAFEYVRAMQARSGGTVSWDELQRFEFEGRRIPLIGQRGIRKVSGFDAALSFMTTYSPRPDERPYDDRIGPDRYVRYKWRGTEPGLYDNVALRRAMQASKPLIWFIGVAPGEYVANFPVWLVGEEPEEHQFVVAMDQITREQWTADLFHPADLAARRQYADRVVRQRVHQPLFRQAVLIAYRSQCSLCRLRHRELLDAAHIREDAEGGEPVVTNGLALCAIHHRAFDADMLGIRPDYVVQIRRDVLEERDGPTLRHALQGLHGAILLLPRSPRARPDQELLEERFDRFLRAG